jgi:Flp pilus assembly pilin Flp
MKYQKTQHLLYSINGQSYAEYTIILSLVAIACISAYSLLGQKIRITVANISVELAGSESKHNTFGIDKNGSNNSNPFDSPSSGTVSPTSNSTPTPGGIIWSNFKYAINPVNLFRESYNTLSAPIRFINEHPAVGLAIVMVPPEAAAIIFGGAAEEEEVIAPEGARYVFDARTGQYRDLTNGRFISARDLPWPEYPGFSGSPEPTTLQPGEIIDRFGSLSGEFAGTPGASASARGLPAGAELRPYTKLEVLKPLQTMSGPAAGVSEFGATGGATQYWFKGGIQQWIDRGYLEVVK